MANALFDSLSQRILRKLGHPVINIELSEDQIEDCIDDALHEFREEHFDGCNIGYIAMDLLKDVVEYELPDDIQEVTHILSYNLIPSTTWTGEDQGLLLSPFYLRNYNTNNYYDIVSIEVFRQQYKTIRDYFEIPILFDYNATTSKLFLHAPPQENMVVFLKVYQANDEEVQKHLGNVWVKKYATELARLQWGRNLMKYNGAKLPGGAEFNHADIRAEAKEELEILREELEDKFSLPLDPQIG